MRIWVLIIKTPKLQSTHILSVHIPRAIVAIATQYPTYGYRLVTAQLRKRGTVVYSNHLHRVMGDMGLQVKSKPKKRRTTNSYYDFLRYLSLV